MSKKEEKTKLEDLELTFVDALGRVKMIKWGKDYLNWSCEDKLTYAEVLASAMNQAADKIQQERNKAYADITQLKALNKSAEQAVKISKETLTKHITKSNAKQQQYMREIAELKKELYKKNKLIENI